MNPDIDLIKGEEVRLRKAAVPYDPGFTVSPARATVGSAVTFDASDLLGWGDASPNSFQWSFGDGWSLTALPSDGTAQHAYDAPGRYSVRLTVSDTDFVNDSANPLTCSAKRTTSLKLTAKYEARADIPSITRVKKGKATTVKVRVWSGAKGTGSIRLQRKSGSGLWSVVQTRAGVTVAAGTWTTSSFTITLNGSCSFRALWSGNAAIWDATSNVRSVKPL